MFLLSRRDLLLIFKSNFTMTFYQQQVYALTSQLYPDPVRTAHIIRSKQFIDLHFAERITLRQMAGQAFLSPFHYIRQFRNFYGQTPGQYLITVRIRNARELLAGGATVRDACLDTGFSSPTTFCTLFRRMTGSTPSAYRKKAILARSERSVLV